MPPQGRSNRGNSSPPNQNPPAQLAIKRNPLPSIKFANDLENSEVDELCCTSATTCPWTFGSTEVCQSGPPGRNRAMNINDLE